MAVPPVLAGATMAVRWREYEEAMRAGRPLLGRDLRLVGVALCVYALLALLASALDR